MSTGYDLAMLAETRALSIRGSIALSTGADIALSGADILSLKVREGVSGGLLPGCAPGAQYTLALANAQAQWLVGGSRLRQRTLIGACVTLEMGVMANNTVQYAPCGRFIVEEARAQEHGAQMTLAGCDAATFALSNLFEDTQAYPRTLADILAHLKALSGQAVTGMLACNGDLQIPETPAWGKGCTLRQALAYVCAAGASVARPTRLGTLEVVPARASAPALALSPAQYMELSTDETLFSLNRVRVAPARGEPVQAAANDALAESRANTLTIERNPLLVQSAALQGACTALLAALSGFCLRGARFAWRGNPRVLVGDRIALTDTRGDTRDLVVCAQSLTFGEGFQMETTCGVPAAHAQARAVTSEGALNGLCLVRGSVGGVAIAEGSVQARHVMAGAIDADKLSAGCVTADKIAAGTIGADKLTAGLIAADSALVARGAIGTLQIADGSITDGKIVSLTASKLTAGTIDASVIAVNNLTADNITTGTLNGQRIPQLGTDKLQDGAVTGGKVAQGAITADKIVAGAVTAEKLAAQAVVANSIASGAVTAAKIDAGAINAAHLSAGCVTAAKIASIDGALEIVSGGSISLQSARAHFATDDFTVTDASGERELFSVDAGEVAIGADVLSAPVIIGNVVNTHASASFPWQGSFQATFAALPKQLHTDVTITVPAGTYVENPRLVGLHGGVLTVLLSSGVTIIGTVTVHGCTAVRIRADAPNTARIEAPSGASYVIYARDSRVTLERLTLSGYTGRTSAANGTDYGVQAPFALLEMTACCIEWTSTYGVYVYLGSRAFLNGLRGGVVGGSAPDTCANLGRAAYVSGAGYATVNGTVPASVAGIGVGMGTLIGGSGAQTSSFIQSGVGVSACATTLQCTAYGLLKQPENSNAATQRWSGYAPRQGKTNGYDHYGLWCFANLADIVSISGTITAARLTLTRDSVYGPAVATVNLYANEMTAVPTGPSPRPVQTFFASAGIARSASYAFDVTDLVRQIKTGARSALGFGLSYSGDYLWMLANATLEVAYTA